MNVFKEPLVLFDGYCNLCDSTVQFIIKEDKKNIFSFAPIQSGLGQSLLEKYDLKYMENKSVVLIDKGKASIKSEAILKILMKLNFYFRVFAALMFIIPNPMRNMTYDFIAGKRYKWFGKREKCLIPNVEIMDRFYQ